MCDDRDKSFPNTCQRRIFDSSYICVVRTYVCVVCTYVQNIRVRSALYTTGQRKMFFFEYTYILHMYPLLARQYSHERLHERLHMRDLRTYYTYIRTYYTYIRTYYTWETTQLSHERLHMRDYVRDFTWETHMRDYTWKTSHERLHERLHMKE